MDHKGVIYANAGEMTTRAAHPLVVLSPGFYCSFLKISVILIDCVLAHLITPGNTADLSEDCDRGDIFRSGWRSCI